MKYHKKTILSPAEIFFLFYQNLRHRKKKSNFCVSKELLQYFTYIPFDLNLDIEMIDRKKIPKMSALRPLCTVVWFGYLKLDPEKKNEKS